MKLLRKSQAWEWSDYVIDLTAEDGPLIHHRCCSEYGEGARVILRDDEDAYLETFPAHRECTEGPQRS